MVQAKDKLLKQKRRYYIIIGFIILGIIVGMIYPYLLGNKNQELLSNSINSYFNSIKNNNYNTLIALKNTSFINVIEPIIIFLLGLSIFGSILIIPILLYKGFILGFSFSSIISIYKFKGFIGAIIYIFPNLILNIIIYILLGFYSISFSIKLFKYLFFHRKIDLNKYIYKYIKIFCIGLIILIFLSFYEVYILPNILKLFTKMI